MSFSSHVKFPEPFPLDFIKEIEKAYLFAAFHHANVDQVRKYSGAPYIVHPGAVCSIYLNAARQNANPFTAQACLLHDVVEDTEATVQDVHRYFGSFVANLVQEVTDVFTPENCPGLNRVKRKELEKNRISCTSPAARIVKLCDLIDNTSDIVANAELGFAKLYLSEKRAILGVLDNCNTHGLWNTAQRQVANSLNTIERRIYES